MARHTTNVQTDEWEARAPKWAYAVAITSGLVLVLVMVGIALFVQHPTTFQVFVFRVVTSLAAAGFGASIPGFLRLRIPLWGRGALHGGGALGLFILVYLVNPPALVTDTPEEIRSKLEDVHRGLDELHEEEQKTQRYLGAVPEEERLREFEKLRSAYLLGFRLALAVVIQASNLSPTRSAEQFVGEQLADVNAHAVYLDLTRPILLSPPAPNDNKTNYVARHAAPAQSIGGEIVQKHGIESKAAFELAFKVGIGPLYVGALSEATQQDVFDGYKHNLRVLGVPESSLTLLQEGFRGADEQVGMNAVFEFKKGVLDTLHARIADTMWRKQRELDTWLYSNNASVIAAGYSTGKLNPNPLT